MGGHVYRGEILAEFICRGLVCEKKIIEGDGRMRGREELRLPRKAEVAAGEIDGISTYFIISNSSIQVFHHPSSQP